jgi:hypothetical protein
MKNKKQIFTTILSVLLPVFLVTAVVYATTTIGDDVTVGDDLTVTGNDITFGNGETISNATNGIIALGGEVQINGVRISNVSGYEYFLNVTGDLTGSTASGTTPGTGSKTRVILVEAARDSANPVEVGDIEDVGMKIAMTNEADNSALGTGYVFRGLDVQAQNKGNVTNLYGAQITSYNKTGTVSQSMVLAANMKCDGTCSDKYYGINIQDQSQGSIPADTVGLFINTLAYAKTRAYAIKIDSAAGSWTNGLSLDGTVTNALDFADWDGTNGAKATGTDTYVITNASTSDAIIKIDIGGTSYWIPAYDAGSITGE